ncbi:MAG: tetratricopeptide repeat protein [Bacteroidota bacterium]
MTKESIYNLEEGMGKSRRADGWNELLVREEDYDLFRRISDYFRGESDIEEAVNDPGFAETCRVADEMISGYISSGVKPENRTFILESTDSEMKGIREEIHRNNLDEISSKWVEEWETKNKNGSKEIREFITNSVGETENQSEKPPYSEKRVSLWPLFLRYALSAAAMIAGIIFVVSVLVQSDDPGRMYDKFYEPLSAISPVTRAGSINGSNKFADVVTLYNKGEYNAAAAGFSEIISSDPSLVTPRFYLGMSHLALGNYGQAAVLLEEVAGRDGEYTKEARWYLGLIYMKEGNEAKARESLEFLTLSEGYYSERSERILRRLR